MGGLLVTESGSKPYQITNRCLYRISNDKNKNISKVGDLGWTSVEQEVEMEIASMGRYFTNNFFAVIGK